MKFERHRRYGTAFCWTPRKLAAAASHGERQRRREADRHPLFADQLPAPAPFDADAEAAAREAASRAWQQRDRDFEARVWREARRDARAATAAQRRAIAEAWDRWTGPRTALYFRCIVDRHTGELDRRQAASRARMRALLLQMWGSPAVQAEIDIAGLQQQES